MNEQHIEDMITVLYDMIQDARSMPLASFYLVILEKIIHNFLFFY